MTRTIIAVASGICFSVLCSAATLTIDTIPSSGDVSGYPGTVVGWGITLTDTGSDWVVLNDSYFTGSQVNGTYVDYVASNFYVAGPSPESPTLMESWNSGTMSGLGEFDLNATAPPGLLISGDINVDYSLFSQDPNNPDFDPDSFVSSGTLSAAVQIQSLPEPASIGLVGLALPLLFAVGMRKRTGFTTPLQP